jgi:hypothetical protein
MKILKTEIRSGQQHKTRGNPGRSVIISNLNQNVKTGAAINRTSAKLSLAVSNFARNT